MAGRAAGTLEDSAERAFRAVADPVRAEIEARLGRIQVRGFLGLWRRGRAVERRIRRRLNRLNAYRLSSPYNV
jgi:hypothetical protein